MEVASQIWHGVFVDIGLPKDGVVVEIAPGYEPKIGNALAAIDFSGTIYLIEPDTVAAKELAAIYRSILPNAKVVTVLKVMQELKLREDIPEKIDVVVASHPFDDMVMGSIISLPNFFTLEKSGGLRLTPKIKKVYDSLTDEHYVNGVGETVKAWKDFLSKIKPSYFIASQYPSTTLTMKGLTRRQNSGYAVMNLLKSSYKNVLLNEPQNMALFPKADPRWWIVANMHYWLPAD
ncbi:MAG: hypothetical protein HY226_01870 [Candidatus Vogelbacteria bacterium]|nr:hypothetical protein [Candidatus Vogelbacteria bacterium]